MTSKINTVVIGGGNGFLGSHLVKAFKKKASQTLIISRMPGINGFSWTDLDKNGFPLDTDVVINIAGQNVLDPTRRWTPSFKQNVISSRVMTTKALAKAIENSKKPPKVFITISGVGYYPPSLIEEYDESFITKKVDFFSNLCHDWENAGNLSKNCSTRRVVIRSGIILGKNGGILSQIWLPFFLGLGGPIGSGKQFMPWIHIQDLVNLFIFSVENEKVLGVINGVAPQIITNREFTKALGKAMFRPTLIPVPEFAIYLAFGKERAWMMTQGQKVIPKRALDLNFKYIFPDINSACKDLVKK